jgi:hypothetical protein
MKTDEIKVIISNPEHKKLADFVGDSYQVNFTIRDPESGGFYCADTSDFWGIEYTVESLKRRGAAYEIIQNDKYSDYSQDWNALMKVVDKIIDQDFSYNLEDSRAADAVCWFIKHYTDGTKWECVESDDEAITAVYQAVLKVIKYLEGKE